MSDINVILTDDIINVTLNDDVINIIFKEWTTGPPWPALAKTHVQSISSNLWTINHNLNTYPAWIVVIDSWWTNIVNFHITYVNSNTLTLEFSGAFTWIAHLS